VLPGNHGILGLIENGRNLFNANLESQNIKRLVTNETASANMYLANQIGELGGGCLVGGND